VNNGLLWPIFLSLLLKGILGSFASYMVHRSAPKEPYSFRQFRTDRPLLFFLPFSYAIDVRSYTHWVNRLLQGYEETSRNSGESGWTFSTKTPSGHAMF
jgi:hypothetical protein